MTERSLAEVVEIESTPPATPQDFDLAAFLGGVRPTRRSVQLHAHGHLIARLEQIAAQIDAAPQGADVDALIDEFEETKTRFKAGVWFTVEKRSSEWVDHFRAEQHKQMGHRKAKNDDGDEAWSQADELTVSLHQLAAQTVEPKVTYEQLRQLLDDNEGELNKLMLCMINVNTRLAQASEVLTRDFSLRRSA
jgi:hypothetical protein